MTGVAVSRGPVRRGLSAKAALEQSPEDSEGVDLWVSAGRTFWCRGGSQCRHPAPFAVEATHVGNPMAVTSPCSVAWPPHSIILSLRFSLIPRDKGLIWGPPVLSPLMKSRLQSSGSPLSFERVMDPQPGFRARCRHGMGTAPNEGCVPCSAAGDRGWQHVARVLCAGGRPHASVVVPFPAEIRCHLRILLNTTRRGRHPRWNFILADGF